MTRGFRKKTEQVDNKDQTSRKEHRVSDDGANRSKMTRELKFVTKRLENLNTRSKPFENKEQSARKLEKPLERD